MRSTLLSLAAAVATGAGFLTIAPAAHAEAGTSALILTTVGGSQTADASFTNRRHVVLACHPEPAGSHPDAKGACATLESVNADLAALPPGPNMCTMEHAPVTVTARGYWHDQPVDYSREFSNPCLAARDTGNVFRF